MSSRLAKATIAVGVLALVAGCEHGPGQQAGAVKFGEPNRMTMMAQVVNPDPKYDQPMTGSADSAAQAIERWRTDKVKKPERVRSTESVRGGGGGGSGN